MQILPLSEFRANVSAMLDLVAQGETVRILRHGKPVADLVPARPEAAPLPHWKQRITPRRVVRPDGKTIAQRIIDEREQARCG
ncbi:type II toxin-antitoxin system Phd/YefM family antitoxin [Pseudorhodoferax sp.]|uniref:type II toxin-antitoxin system Phd/YefM family antitoxin n=1 Tax=Pseudorhodoferax sp. TaxID=1993553 RepID=UPI0039E6F1DD